MISLSGSTRTFHILDLDEFIAVRSNGNVAEPLSPVGSVSAEESHFVRSVVLEVEVAVGHGES